MAKKEEQPEHNNSTTAMAAVKDDDDEENDNGNSTEVDYQNDGCTEFDILIVGAELAGLVTAYTILKKQKSLRIVVIDRKVLLQEDDGYGIVANCHDNEDCEFLNIGQWALKDHQHILELCRELDVKLEGVRGSWPNRDACYLATFELNRFLKEIDIMALFYHRHYHHSSSTITLDKFIKSKLIFKSSQNFIQFAIRAIFGLDAKVVLLPEFLRNCYTSNGITKQLECLLGIGQVFRINWHELKSKLIKKISSVFIVSGLEVTKILQSNNNVQIFTSNTRRLQASVVVLSMSWQSISDISFEPSFIQELLIHQDENWNMVTKFITEFSEPINLHTLINHDNWHIVCYNLSPKQLAGTIYHKRFQVPTQSIILDMLKINVNYLAKWRVQTRPHAQYLKIQSINPYNRIVFGSTNATVYNRGLPDGIIQGAVRASTLALLSLRPQIIDWRDLAEIQSPEFIHHDIDYHQIMWSSVNLYTSVCYTIISCCLLGTYGIMMKFDMSEQLPDRVVEKVLFHFLFKTIFGLRDVIFP